MKKALSILIFFNFYSFGGGSVSKNSLVEPSTKDLRPSYTIPQGNIPYPPATPPQINQAASSSNDSSTNYSLEALIGLCTEYKFDEIEQHLPSTSLEKKEAKQLARNLVAHLLIPNQTIAALKAQDSHLSLTATSNDDIKKSALHEAAGKNLPNILRFFIFRLNVDPNILDGFNSTPLFYAVRNKAIDSIKALLGHQSTKPNAQNLYQKQTGYGRKKRYKDVWENSLILACRNCSYDIASLLLSHPKIDPNIRDSEGNTPLNIACILGNSKIAELLLSHKEIKVNTQNKQKKSPLFNAIEKQNVEIVKMLLQHRNIIVTQREKNFQTPNKEISELMKYLTIK